VNGKIIESNPKQVSFGNPFPFDSWIDSQLLKLHSNSTTSTSTSTSSTSTTSNSDINAQVINMWKGHEKTIDLIIGNPSTKTSKTSGSIPFGEIHGHQQSLFYQVRGQSHIITFNKKYILKQGNMVLLNSHDGLPIITQVNHEHDDDDHVHDKTNDKANDGATLVIRNLLKDVAQHTK